MIGQIIGSAIGGIAGAAITGYQDSQRRKEAREAINNAKADYNTQMASIEQQLNSYYSDPSNFLGTKSDVDAYRKLIANYNPSDYVYDFNDFSYNKTTDDFLNPYMDRIIADVTNNVENSASGAGLGQGTGAANAIAKATAEKEDELYRTAMSDMQNDRAFAYQTYSDNITNNQNRLNALNQNYQAMLNSYGNLATDYSNQRQNYISDKTGIGQAKADANLTVAGLKAGL